MRKLVTATVVFTLVAGALVGFAGPGQAVHGCILSSPSPGAPVPDQPNIGPPSCDIAITPGGAYNITVAAEDWLVIVTQGSTTLTFNDQVHGPVARIEAVSAANAANGGTISATVSSGVLVVGCAACEPPPA